MSKITLSVIVYAPCLNKTTIKSNKNQMNSSAETFFWMNRYEIAKNNLVPIKIILLLPNQHPCYVGKLSFSFVLGENGSFPYVNETRLTDKSKIFCTGLETFRPF